MNLKRSCFALLGFTLLCASSGLHAAQNDTKPLQFEQFPADFYRGKLKIPRGVYKDSEGQWRDEGHKLVAPLMVNFAGEYYLAAHSCGTGCRYYTLNNLRTGRDVSQVSMFNADEPVRHTRDGHTYVPILFFKPDSILLIAQYALDVDKPTQSNQCRQRYFAFKNGTFTAISRTFPSCSREGNEPE
jgi:hypothetical protein